MKHLAAIWTFRHFLFALVRLDLRMKYKRSILGVGWSLLHPISMTIVYTIVFSQILGADAKTYGPFLLSGMVLWAFVQQGAVGGSRALIANEAYIRQSPLPFGLYSLRVVLGNAIHLAIALVVVVALIMYLQDTMDALLVLPYVLPGLMILFVATWAIATMSSFANVYFHDTQHLLEVVFQIGFFLTPIIYYRGVLDKQNLGWLVDLNPVNLFLELIRAPLLSGVAPDPALYPPALALTAVLVGLAVGTMAWLQKRVIFHL